MGSNYAPAELWSPAKDSCDSARTAESHNTSQEGQLQSSSSVACALGDQQSFGWSHQYGYENYPGSFNDTDQPFRYHTVPIPHLPNDDSRSIQCAPYVQHPSHYGLAHPHLNHSSQYSQEHLGPDFIAMDSAPVNPLSYTALPHLLQSNSTPRSPNLRSHGHINDHKSIGPPSILDDQNRHLIAGSTAKYIAGSAATELQPSSVQYALSFSLQKI